jgi:hypothetical protein
MKFIFAVERCEVVVFVFLGQLLAVLLPVQVLGS